MNTKQKMYWYQQANKPKWLNRKPKRTLNVIKEVTKTFKMETSHLDNI